MLYTVNVYKNTKPFEYKNITYKPGDSFKNEDACEIKRFLAAAAETNPNYGLKEETKGVMKSLEKECPAITNEIAPPQSPTAPPDESSDALAQGDSAESQGSPSPPVSTGIIRDSPEGSPETSSSSTEEPARPPLGQKQSTHGDEQPQQQTDAGEPVDIFQGCFYLQETDLLIPNTLLPLVFVRIYRSGAPAFGPLGWNWDHNHNLHIRELDSGNIALWRNLHEDEFKFDGVAFEPPCGVFEKLERIAGLIQAYELTAEGGVVMHFERPIGWIDGERIPLVWIKDRHGNKLLYKYGAQDKVVEIRDDDDHALQFQYDFHGFLIAVSDTSGRAFKYQYNRETMQLVYVRSPATSDHPKGITKIYYYYDPWTPSYFRNNIVRIEDSEGNTYLENKYDEDPGSWSYSRVIEQYYGQYLFQYRYTPLQWVPSNALFINIPAVRVEVMNPDFGLETYTFNYRGDLLDKRFRLTKDKSLRVIIWQYEYDSQGNLSRIVAPDGSSEILTYDFSNLDPRMRGKLLKKEMTSALMLPAPSRIVWRGKYESSYQLLIEETNESQATTHYKYDFDRSTASIKTGKLEKIIQPQSTLPDGTIQISITKYENNSRGQIEAIVLPDGTRHEMTYGTSGYEKGRVVTKKLDVFGLNVQKTIAYDSYGYESEIKDGNGNTSKKVCNALGLVEENVLPSVSGSSAVYIMHYNSDNKLIAFERPKGNFEDQKISGNYIIDTFERCVLGFPTKYHFSSNTDERRDVRICPDFRGYPIKILNPDGSTLIRTYDERGLLLHQEVTGKDGSQLSVSRMYNSIGSLIREISALRAPTIYKYDGFGRLVKKTFPNGTEKTLKWGKSDSLLSEEIYGDDGFGNNRLLSKQLYEYDEKSRRIRTIEKLFIDDPITASDLVTNFYYDKLDRVEKVVDNRGRTKTYRYDGLGHILTQIDPMGNEESNTYDKNGNLIQTDSSQKEPNGTISVISKKYSYDERNRRVETIEPDGTKLVQKYDDRNLIVSQTDHLGIMKKITYDSFNLCTSETCDVDGLSLTHYWTLDSMSRVTAYIDPIGLVSSYHLDGIGRVNKIEYPNGFSSTKVFDEIGRVSEEILGSGVKFSYIYDTANRLTCIKNRAVPISINQVQSHEYHYDGLNRTVSAKVGENVIIRKYDSKNRLVLERTLGKDMVCKYDDFASTVKKTWPDGRTEKYTHDLNGVVSTIEEVVNGPLGAGDSLIASFKPSGSTHFGEGLYQGQLKTKNTYDERKRLVEIATSSSAGIDEKIEYRYDKANRMQVEAFLGQNSKISYFEFDNKYRLKVEKDRFNALVPSGLTQIENDAAINAIKAASAAALHEELYDYNPGDDRIRLEETGFPDKNYIYLYGHRIKNDGKNDYAYSTDGTVCSDGNFKYKVDALGRIIEIQSTIGNVCKIEFDAFGRPSVIGELGKPDKSLNYLGSFVEQENVQGVASRQITVHPITGVPIAYHSASGTYYVLVDSRFNLIGLANNKGTLLETYRYKAFGLPEIYDSSGNRIAESNFGIEPFFGGQKLLSSAGLYLSKRRLMNPSNGVYLSADPQGYGDSPSLYVYVAQNPISNIDPEGGIIPFIIAAFVIGGALVGAGYSFYDAYHHPEKYEGEGSFWRPLANTFGGAAIGGVSVVAGEAVLGLGGAGIFATSSGATAVTLTSSQAFILYGTSSATTGYFLRSGFNKMFPEYVDPASARTMAIDYAFGGGISVFAKSFGILDSRTTVWSLQGDREAILESRRIWGQTEGSVYAMDTPSLPTWRATGGGTVGSNSAIFRFSGENNVFQPHEITGPFSLIKRLLGQSKAGFGDIAFEEATQVGTRLVGGNEIPIYNLTGVRLLPGEFAGQSATWAASRLWGRRALDGTLTAGLLLASGLNIYKDYGTKGEGKPKK